MTARTQSERAERYERLREVLTEETITAVYQPIMELESRRVIAYEALSRFPGDKGYTPDRWFGDAWELGLGVELELLAMRITTQALTEIPPEIALCINASPSVIASERFIPHLRGRVHRVVVELTEHFGIEDSADLRSRLEPLRQEGGRTAIDDFGAGYASLKHIVSVEPDWIKLDISLTERLDESPIAYALTSAVVAFADQVGISVVAEGIETVDELDAVADLGIRYGQGFHLGMPAPLDEALASASS